MMEVDNLRKVAGYDFHHLRKKYDVRTMRGILTHIGDSYRASSRLRDLTGIHLLISRSDSSQTSPSGLVMTRKRLCVLMEIL